MDYVFIFAFICLTILFVVIALSLSRVFAPHFPETIKNQTYECGEQTIGSTWIHFNVGYYLFALMFLIFDVETTFLYPWAVAFREAGWIGFYEILLFLLILFLGLIYAWKKGVLEWT